ncbi:hypothetical protein ACOSQ2_005687 [Xanthoceras sorbifolium]
MAFSRRGEPSSPNPLAQTPSHFFKVILPATLEDKKLRIPENFVRKFGDELSAAVTLTVPNGRTWHVQLTKDEKKIWLHDGWHDFVKCYSICAGYFLVFKYGKNSSFHVLIFDKTACEVQYEKNLLNPDEMKIEIMDFATPNSPSNSSKNKAFDKCRSSSSKIYAPQSQLKKEKPSSGLVLGTNRCRKCSASFETLKFKHPNNPDSSTQDAHEEVVKMQFRYYGSASARKRKVRTNEREREIHAAKAFEPANPYCRVVLQPSYLTIMCLPSSFSKKHFNGVSGFIKLQISNGKQWTVRCINRRQRAVFSQGWRAFILDNNLGEGDVCVFEVLRSRDIVVKVSVFRVLKSAEFVNRPSFGSARGSNRSRKCVASPENPKYKHPVDMRSKRCKIEELDEINKSDALGDESELTKARHKVEAHSSDKENERTKLHGIALLGLLEDMGISVSKNFRHIAAEERGRAIAAARLFKPKNPSFMVILQPDNLKSRRVLVPVKFAMQCLSRDSKCIKVQDSDGREWPGITTWCGGYCRIKGLAGLLREKNLDEGDICIFELIRVNELKVSIFYASS